MQVCGKKRREFGKWRAGNRIEDIDGHDVCADGFQFKREVAAVGARLAHADDAAGTNLDAGLFQIADGLQPIVERVRGAGLREKIARAFEIVAVAFHAGFFQAVGDALAFDEAEGNVGARLATSFQFADAVAAFIEHRAFIQPFPRGDEAHGGDVVEVRFIGGFGDRFGFNKAVFRRACLIMRRLRAEAAILGTRARLGVDDGTEMNLVALELFTDAVGPRQQIEDVSGGFEVDEPVRLIAGNVPAAQNSFTERGKFLVICRVNRFCCHG